MTAVYLDVEPDPALFPQNGKGNPKSGQFQYNRVDIQTNQFGGNSIAIAADNEASVTIYVAFHAMVNYVGTDRIEGAWAQGLLPFASTGEFSGPSWATYISYVSQPIYWWEEPPEE